MKAIIIFDLTNDEAEVPVAGVFSAPDAVGAIRVADALKLALATVRGRDDRNDWAAVCAEARPALDSLGASLVAWEVAAIE